MALKDNPVIQKGIRRLRAKGLKVAFEEVEEDRWGVIAIDILSIVNYIKRVIESEMRFPNMFVYIDLDSKTMEIHVWRGTAPEKIRELMRVAREKEELLKELERVRGS